MLTHENQNFNEYFLLFNFLYYCSENNNRSTILGLKDIGAMVTKHFLVINI